MKNILFLFFAFLLIACNAQPPAYYEDIRAFKKLDSIQQPPKHAILFVGSSTFTKWSDMQAAFPGHTIINRGFGGSTLTDVIRYAEDVIIPYQPKQVLVYCGENDLANGERVTADMVLDRFKRLFRIIRKALPETYIDFVSIKPSPVRTNIQEKVKEANIKIKKFLARQNYARFIDIYPAMLDPNGNMREELFISDRLHMNAEGYAIWQKIIGPYLIK